MNVTYFVLTAALLTFATGFFVASIIWSIKWVLLSSDRKSDSRKSVHLLHIFSGQTTKGDFASRVTANSPDTTHEESVHNKELYQYYHGKN